MAFFYAVLFEISKYNPPLWLIEKYSNNILNYSFNEDLIKSLLFPIIDLLSSKFNFHLDIEFFVKDNICYILKVRPIVSKLNIFEG